MRDGYWLSDEAWAAIEPKPDRNLDHLIAVGEPEGWRARDQPLRGER